MNKSCVFPSNCPEGSLLPLVPMGLAVSHGVQSGQELPENLRVGDVLASAAGENCLRILHKRYVCLEGDSHTRCVPFAQALRPLGPGRLNLGVQRNGHALAWVCVSDKGAAAARTDTSGPALASMLADVLCLRHQAGFMVPDEMGQIRALVADLAFVQGYELVVLTGGTGLSPRDVTPEAVLPLLDKRLHGFEQAMMQASLKVTVRACISRVLAGTAGQALVLALPGSRKAATENLAAVIGALGHALEKLHGNQDDCGVNATSLRPETLP